MFETGDNSNGVNVDSKIERCMVHGDRCTIDTEDGQRFLIRDADDFFDCSGLPATPQERLQKLRVDGLAVLEELVAEYFTNNPQVVDALEWVRDYVSATPLPDGNVQIVLEGQEWWAAGGLWALGLSTLPHAEKADPRWLWHHEVTGWILESVDDLREHAAIARTNPSLFDLSLDSAGLGDDSTWKWPCEWL